MVDTGLIEKMNLNILIECSKKYKLNLKLINSSRLFLQKLKIFQIQKKRKIIGKLFIKILKQKPKSIKI